MERLTLAQIEAMDRDMLTPVIVSKYLGCDDHTIRLQARQRPDLLGFPVICLGTRVKIPKAGFVAYCKGQLGCRQAG